MSESTFKHRETQLHRWFSMWLDRKDGGIGKLFAPEAVYIESWGPSTTAAKK